MLMPARRHLKADVIYVVTRFMEQATAINDLWVIHSSVVQTCINKLLDRSDDGWQQFVKQFADSVRHITGQNLEATLASDDRETILREELESLRTKVDELTDEVRTNPVNQH